MCLKGIEGFVPLHNGYVLSVLEWQCSGILISLKPAAGELLYFIYKSFLNPRQLKPQDLPPGV